MSHQLYNMSHTLSSYESSTDISFSWLTWTLKVWRRSSLFPKYICRFSLGDSDRLSCFNPTLLVLVTGKYVCGGTRPIISAAVLGSRILLNKKSQGLLPQRNYINLDNCGSVFIPGFFSLWVRRAKTWIWLDTCFLVLFFPVFNKIYLCYHSRLDPTIIRLNVDYIRSSLKWLPGNHFVSSIHFSFFR